MARSATPPAVPCPTCRAPAGGWCVTGPKRGRTTEHTARIRAVVAARDAAAAAALGGSEHERPEDARPFGAKADAPLFEGDSHG